MTIQSIGKQLPKILTLPRIKALLPRACLYVMLGIAGLLYGRLILNGLLHPAAESFLLSVISVGLPPLPALLGCIAGVWGQDISLMLPGRLLPLVMIAFIGLLWHRTGKPLQGTSGYIILVAARLLYLPFQTLLLYDILIFSIETIISLALYACFQSAFTCLISGKLSQSGPRLCLMIALCAMMGGLPGGIGSFSFPAAVGCLAVLSVAYLLTMAEAAVAALAVGIAMNLSGNMELWIIGGLGISGLVAGSLRSLGKPGILSGALLTSVIMGMISSGSPWAMIHWSVWIAVGSIYLLIPRKAWQYASSRLMSHSSEAAPEDPKRSVTQQLSMLSDCFSELSAVFRESSIRAPRFDIADILEVMSAHLCNDCPKKSGCWSLTSYHRWEEYIISLQNNFQAALPLTLASREFCPHYDKIEPCFYLLSRIHCQTQEETLLGQLVGDQLSGVSRIMSELCQKIDLDAKVKDDYSRAVRSILAERGLPYANITVHQEMGKQYSVRMTIPSCGGAMLCQTDYQEALTRAMGREMIRMGEGCSGHTRQCELIYYSKSTLQVSAYSHQIPADGSVCGDNCLLRDLHQTGYMLALSDGMGSGVRAARESDATIRMLRSFYEAGFGSEVIFRTINSALLLRGNGDMYATVDLCLIDMQERKADFIKIGACSSYLIRDGVAKEITSPSLPLGILDSIKPAILTEELQDGDVIVLMSDGAQQNSRELQDLLADSGDLMPQVLAEKLTRFAAAAQTHSDDITVIVANIRDTDSGLRHYSRSHMHSKWQRRVGA